MRSDGAASDLRRTAKARCATATTDAEQDDPAGKYIERYPQQW